MHSFSRHFKSLAVVAVVASFIAAPIQGLQAASKAAITPAKSSGLGVITGFVRDAGGDPIADATVAIFRIGTSQLLKQVASAANGKFVAKITPGRYSVLAVAQGFNPISLPSVEVGQDTPVEYGFRLERAGSGNTLPEKRLDRNNPKWSVRSSAISRAIYQNREDNDPAMAASVTVSAAESSEESNGRRAQTVAGTYFASSDRGNFTGFNVATLIPLKENADLMIAGQTGVGNGAPQRLDTELRFKPVEDHQLRVRASYAKLGNVPLDEMEKTLGQFSFQATDEWQIKDGVVLVLGLDYSKFTGAGDDFSISPRIGFQYDIDPKTRFRSAYATQTEPRTWSRAIELEGMQIAFREPVSMNDIFVENGKPLMDRSTRFEFGIERVLDNNSTLEANVFADTVFSKGVGYTLATFDSADSAFRTLTANQQGSARGMRVVYARRIGSRFTATAGYSFGLGQKLSADAVSTPDDLFINSFVQTMFGQIEADLRTGTHVKTVFRFSPEATLYSIDPFQGRLSVYDPGFSILVTQNLPTLGLPFHAQAIVDARNLFDTRNGFSGDEGSVRLNSGGKMIRGGILVRF